MPHLNNIEQKIKFLIKQINQANYQYYNLSNPEINDQQYDALLKQLITLEQKYPQYQFPYSPTLKIGGFIEKKFKTVKHLTPMMSLANAFNLEELQNFYNRICKIKPTFTLLTELKIDGVAVSLKYEKGILTQALTRGNGILGEDITRNIQTIKTVPLKLNQAIDLEVRGEVYLSYQAFEKLNEQRKKETKPLFVNPRNAASGTLRQLNSTIVAQRNLSIFIYNITNPYLIKKTQKEALEFLISLGFTVNPHYHLASSFQELIANIKNYQSLKEKLPYDADGIVIKINELELHSLIGATSKVPKWAIAYKFETKSSQSIVQNIIFQLGRTGVITPVCEIMPVMVDGSLISKVVLHNYDYICKKDIRIGDHIKIHKAGSVIPEILEVIKSKRNKQPKTLMISQCPYCLTNLIKKEGEVDYFCLNDNCYQQKIQKLIHYVSKNAMDIDVLGEQTIITLFNQNLIKQPSDLYLLHNHVNIIKTIPGFGEKKINKILKGVEASKNKSLENALFALGIKHIGIKIAQVLANNFKTINKIITASFTTLTNIEEIGDKIAESLQQYFSNPNHLEEITKMQNLGVAFKSNNTQKQFEHNLFTHKKIVFTGTLEQYNRFEITKTLKNMGAIIVNSLSSQTDYLIVGNNAGSKLTKAKQLKIAIIEENQLQTLLKENQITKNNNKLK
ncbi:NAD-dependent DNA ligase LigA [Candidatus Phytoplasma meliae]|uniref:DNA ligase n=1 Tax=Candidatus Phytoplasma meliae TaxID=1848402 RepID=A0ABS5CXM0_9MOLU|nr:NAD-dependent DNA ligase LigA [Candidatus Phytoplasma meliae]MBP5835729.1 NAD-dependent DNA ligase LigA [Candidatus Phytoplasma meliae]